MANFVKIAAVSFIGSTVSSELKIDYRDVITAIEVPVGFLGTSLSASFDFVGDGVVYVPVYNEAGTQVCKIVHPGSLNASYSVSQDDWDITDRLKFTSSVPETVTLKIITKTRK